MAQEPAKTTGKQMVPLKGGAFTLPASASEAAHLIGATCSTCGAIFFPKKAVCLACGNRHLEDKLLSPRGKIHSYTIAWRGQEYSLVKPPFGLVLVQLPEGIAVKGVVTENIEDLAIGKDVQLTVEKVAEDEEGNIVMGHKFRLV